MSNIFDLKKNIHETLSEADHLVREFERKFKKAEYKKTKLNKEVSVSVLKYLYANADPKTKKDMIREILNHAPGSLDDIFMTKHYSRMNILIRFMQNGRKINKLEEKLGQIKRKIQSVIDRLKEIESELEQYPKLKAETLSAIENARTYLASAKYTKFKKWDVNVLDQFFYDDFEMTKDQFIQLINLKHDPGVIEYINNLPEQIDYDTFIKAILFGNIEADDFWQEYVLDMILSNKNAKEKMKQYVDEWARQTGIRTYTPIYDQFGEVVDFKINPPKLTVY